MGSATSRFTERFSSSTSSRSRSIPPERPKDEPDEEKSKKTERVARTNAKKTGDYLVHFRRGSMFLDEDGDLAHEFYVEIPATEPGKKPTMARVYDNLKPEGLVPYTTARLSPDYPFVVADL